MRNHCLCELVNLKQVMTQLVYLMKLAKYCVKLNIDQWTHILAYYN